MVEFLYSGIYNHSKALRFFGGKRFFAFQVLWWLFDFCIMIKASMIGSSRAYNSEVHIGEVSITGNMAAQEKRAPLTYGEIKTSRSLELLNPLRHLHFKQGLSSSTNYSKIKFGSHYQDGNVIF